jgi:hypothetical protein
VSLEQLLAGGPSTRPARQFDGPQAGRVLRVDAGGRLFVTLDALGADVEVGPVRWARPLAPHSHTDPDGTSSTYTPPAPPAGTPVLVLFARGRDGSSTPWAAAFDGWPA